MTVSVAAIYLAAGESRRMGVDKRMLVTKKGPLGSLALRQVMTSNISKTVIVTKYDDPLSWATPVFKGQTINQNYCQVANPEASYGQSTSIKIGLKVAREMKCDAAMILLADQPLVTTELIDRLIDCYIASKKNGKGAEFVASSHNGILKPPVLFNKSCFPALFGLKGDQGARHLIRQSALKGEAVECTDSQLFFDVDTHDDYIRLLEAYINT